MIVHHSAQTTTSCHSVLNAARPDLRLGAFHHHARVLSSVLLGIENSNCDVFSDVSQRSKIAMFLQFHVLQNIAGYHGIIERIFEVISNRCLVKIGLEADRNRDWLRTRFAPGIASGHCGDS